MRIQNFQEKSITTKFSNFIEEFANVELLNLPLERNIAWLLLSAVGNNILEEKLPSIYIGELKVIGSWAAFLKGTSHLKP